MAVKQVAGMALGAAKKAVEAKMKGTIALVLALAMLPFGALLLIMGVSTTGTQAMAYEQAMQENGQAASGIPDKEKDRLTDIASRTGVPWQVMFALYKTQSGSVSADPMGTTPGAMTDPGTPAGVKIPGLERCDPWATRVAQYLQANWPKHYGDNSIGCGRDDHDSDHNSGNALDYMFTPTTESPLAREVTAFLMKNADALSIKYLILEQQIWVSGKDGYGAWRGMSDRGTVSANHLDHIHISFKHPGADGDKTAGTPGTFDFNTPKPTITPEDIQEAFSGSGGEDPNASEGDDKGEAGGTANPFQVLPNDPASAEGDDGAGPLPEDLSDVDAVGEWLARKLQAQLAQDPDYTGQDIGSGLGVDSNDQVYIKSSQAERDHLQEIWTRALMGLPVAGHESEQWADVVWTAAVNLRMGRAMDPCAPTAAGVVPIPAPAPSPSVDPSSSATPSASPSPSASASPSPGAEPSVPAGVSVPFVVKPSRAYDGAPSPDYNKVTVTAAGLRNVAVVSMVAKELFPDKAQYDRAMVIAVITMLVETGLTNDASKAVPESFNFPHDNVSQDHTSVGIFQQLAYTSYYGTVEQLMDPAYQAYMFFGAPRDLHGPLPKDVSRRGILYYGKKGGETGKGKDWMVETPGNVAADIQNPAKQYRYRYDLWVDAAAQVIQAATGISVDPINPGGCISGPAGLTGGGAPMGVAPASGKLVSPVGPGASPGIYMSAHWERYPSGGPHWGIDIATDGWTVQSVCDGTIKDIKINPRYANTNAKKTTGSTNYIWVDCGNGVLMGYAHFYARDLNSSLKEGMEIGAGTPLFPVGNQGNSSGTHLHYQVSTNNSMGYNRASTVDPVKYLAQFGITLPPYRG